jgi:hypothetical protein
LQGTVDIVIVDVYLLAVFFSGFRMLACSLPLFCRDIPELFPNIDSYGLIHMSAIDFSLDISRVQDPGGAGAYRDVREVFTLQNVLMLYGAGNSGGRVTWIAPVHSIN